MFIIKKERKFSKKKKKRDQKFNLSINVLPFKTIFNFLSH